MEHPIQGLMKTALENLGEMTDVNTIIGDPIHTPDGGVILTVSKVGFGFEAGGSDLSLKSSPVSESIQPKSFGGGSGGGVSIQPIAFLVVNQSGVKLLHMDKETHIYERLLELAPQAVEKIQSLFQKKKGETFEFTHGKSL